jgi:hypothetical protein
LILNEKKGFDFFEMPLFSAQLLGKGQFFLGIKVILAVKITFLSEKGGYTEGSFFLWIVVVFVSFVRFLQKKDSIKCKVQ